MRGGGPLLTSRGLSKEEEYLLPIEALGRMKQPTKLLLLEVSRCHSLLVGQPSLPLHSLCSHLLSRRLGTLGFGGSLAHHHQVVGTNTEVVREKPWPDILYLTAASVQEWWLSPGFAPLLHSDPGC